MACVEEVKAVTNALDIQNSACLRNIIKRGFSLRHLHDFIKSHPKGTLQNVAKETRKLLSAEDEKTRSDLFFDIYQKINTNLHTVCTIADVLFFTELICILELLMHMMPSPPSLILCGLFNSIPAQLQTKELLNDVSQKVFSISSDIGDKTHLCRLFTRLSPKWDSLKELLCWITLKHLLNVEKSPADTPSIPKLHNMISSYGSPRTVRSLAMTIRLVGMLIPRLALKETGKNVQESSKWLNQWLRTLPSQFNTIFLQTDPMILDVIKLQALITDITTGWPIINDENESM